jgi:hypothetical protein
MMRDVALCKVGPRFIRASMLFVLSSCPPVLCGMDGRVHLIKVVIAPCLVSGGYA